MSRTGGPTLTERRGEALRLEVSRAAMRIFGEDGDATATVERIAAEAGISTRTFHRHFPSKADVVRPVFRASSELVIGRLRAATDTDVVECLARALLAEADETGMTPVEASFMHVVVSTPEYRMRWFEDDEALAAAVTEFLSARVALPAEPTLRVLPGLLLVRTSRYVFDQWLQRPEQDLADLMRRALTMVIQGVATL